ncbi:MAG: hypothetical protein ABW022_28830 [Actinoplanes sp.]
MALPIWLITAVALAGLRLTPANLPVQAKPTEAQRAKETDGDPEEAVRSNPATPSTPRRVMRMANRDALKFFIQP